MIFFGCWWIWIKWIFQKMSFLAWKMHCWRRKKGNLMKKHLKIHFWIFCFSPNSTNVYCISNKINCFYNLLFVFCWSLLLARPIRSAASIGEVRWGTRNGREGAGGGVGGDRGGLRDGHPVVQELLLAPHLLKLNLRLEKKSTASLSLIQKILNLFYTDHR